MYVAVTLASCFRSRQLHTYNTFLASLTYLLLMGAASLSQHTLANTSETTTLLTELTPLASERSGLLFSLHGSNTVGAKLAPELAKRYLLAKGLDPVRIQPRNTDNEYRVVGYHGGGQAAFIDIAAHGSSTGFRALNQGDANIAMASRPIKAKEKKLLQALGNLSSSSAEHVVAIDGLAVIVHPDNPIDALRIDQVAAIFSGQFTNWTELGGANLDIQRFARDDQSGTWETFKKLVLGKTATLQANTPRFESNDELSEYVSSTRGGIGFVGLASIGQSKAVAIADGDTRALLPTVLSVATEDYPLARRLYLYSSEYPNNGLVSEFLQFVQNPITQTTVGDIGYVSQMPIGVPYDSSLKGPEKYMALIGNAERLSVNFRFKPGSASLDNKAQQDIVRLASLINSGAHKGKQLQLIGFGDSKHTSQRALVLSRLRAITVRSALLKHGITTAPIAGFGDQLPVANNNSANKAKNQRVEVWLR